MVWRGEEKARIESAALMNIARAVQKPGPVLCVQQISLRFPASIIAIKTNSRIDWLIFHPPLRHARSVPLEKIKTQSLTRARRIIIFAGTIASAMPWCTCSFAGMRPKKWDKFIQWVWCVIIIFETAFSLAPSRFPFAPIITYEGRKSWNSMPKSASRVLVTPDERRAFCCRLAKSDETNASLLLLSETAPTLLLLLF